MFKRDESFYIVDLLIACNKVMRYTHRFKNADDFRWSELEWDATLRELEIVGESVNKLIGLGVLNNKQHRKIVDFRNVIVHGYFGVDEIEVWSVVKVKLPDLCDEVREMIQERSVDINFAVECAIEENERNEKVVSFLKSLL